MSQKQKLIDIILKDSNFQFSKINSYNVEKYKILINELLVGCKYNHNIEYKLMKFANSISSINSNKIYVKSSCPIQKCLDEIDNIQMFKRTFFNSTDEKEVKIKNQLFKLKSKLKFIKYNSKANYTNVLKELNTKDIDFTSLRNNYDFILFKGDFKIHNYILRDVHTKMQNNYLYNRYNNDLDIQYIKNKNSIWKLWINQK